MGGEGIRYLDLVTAGVIVIIAFVTIYGVLAVLSPIMVHLGIDISGIRSFLDVVGVIAVVLFVAFVIFVYIYKLIVGERS